jgi:tetratricopeptide (TPR) repeat protein
MLGVLAILIVCLYLLFVYPIGQFLGSRKADEEKAHTEKYNVQMKKLWDVAQTSMRERKPLRAEKALLTILKFDEKNAAAYNRLGILYAKEQNYDEAIECFEIAQSLDNNASSLHNAGLIYLETGAYEKAAMAFEQALNLEDNLPARYIALSKAYEKMGQRKRAVEALEKAYEIDDSVATLRLILSIYENAEDTEKINETTARIEKKMAEDIARREAEAAAKKAAAEKAATPRRAAKIFYPKRRQPVSEAPAQEAVSAPRPQKKASRFSKKPKTPKLVQ